VRGVGLLDNISVADEAISGRACPKGVSPLVGLVPKASCRGDKLREEYGVPGGGVDGGVEGRAKFGENEDVDGRNGPELDVGPRWDIGTVGACCDAFGGNTEGKPPEGCLVDENPFVGPMPFCRGNGEDGADLV
jgi:hypothetical protein